MNPKPTNIHLSVRRWRDKTYGNSYFSARIYADGELVRVLPFQYGYGSAPDATALAETYGRGPGHAYLSGYCREHGIRYTEDDCAALKRECVAHGKED